MKEIKNFIKNISSLILSYNEELKKGNWKESSKISQEWSLGLERLSNLISLIDVS